MTDDGDGMMGVGGGAFDRLACNRCLTKKEMSLHFLGGARKSRAMARQAAWRCDEAEG